MMIMKLQPEDKFFIQSINRALLIVDVIAKSEERRLTLSSIAEKVDLPVSTTYRILQNLIAWQYIKEDENGMYSLGFELITLGNIAKNNLGLRNIAHKYMAELGNMTGETIYLSVLDETRGEVMYIDKIDSRGNIKLAAGIGSRNPIHTTANGKVLISQFSEEKIKNLLGNKKMEKRTENTITDMDSFLKEIKKVCLDGYAIDNMENEPGVRCVAAPILDYRHKIVGSISLSGVISNVTIENIEEKYKHLVLETAYKISSELGYRKED